MLERTRVCPIRVPHCSSGWVSVTNTDFEVGWGSFNVELDRATRNPAVFQACLAGLTLPEVLVRFDMGLCER